MQTATEKILLKAIEIAKLDLGNFYEFCQEIIVSKQSTEIVLLALLQRINNTSWKENNRMYDLLQMNLYWFLLKNGKVTEKIVSQVLEIAKPRGSMYYQFYHMVIQKFGKKQKTARQLSKILERDEIRLGKKYHASRKKLTLLLENQI